VATTVQMPFRRGLDVHILPWWTQWRTVFRHTAKWLHPPRVYQVHTSRSHTIGSMIHHSVRFPTWSASHHRGLLHVCMNSGGRTQSPWQLTHCLNPAVRRRSPVEIVATTCQNPAGWTRLTPCCAEDRTLRRYLTQRMGIPRNVNSKMPEAVPRWLRALWWGTGATVNLRRTVSAALLQPLRIPISSFLRSGQRSGDWVGATDRSPNERT